MKYGDKNSGILVFFASSSFSFFSSFVAASSAKAPMSSSSSSSETQFPTYTSKTSTRFHRNFTRFRVTFSLSGNTFFSSNANTYSVTFASTYRVICVRFKYRNAKLMSTNWRMERTNCGCKRVWKRRRCEKARKRIHRGSVSSIFFMTTYVCGTLKERIFCGEMI